MYGKGDNVKKFVSLLLGICIFVINSIVPLAAEEILFMFQDSDGNEITNITMSCGDEYYYYYQYTGNDELEWTPSKRISVDTDKQCITALTAGSAYLTATNEEGNQVGKLTITITEASAGTDDDEKVEIDDGKTDEKGDDGKTDEKGDDNKGDVSNESAYFYTDYDGDVKEITLNVGTSRTLGYYSSSENSDMTSWTFYSEDSNIASVTIADGCCNISANGSGTTYIVVTNGKNEIGRLTVYVSGDDETEEGDDGKTDEKGDGSDEGKGDDDKNPTASDMPTAITIYNKSISLKVGDTCEISYDLSPEGASADKLIWSVESVNVYAAEEPTLAVVSVENGIVTALNPGYATVYVQNTNYTYLGSIEVEVTSPIIEMTGITLDKTEITLKKGNTTTIAATIVPDGATCDNLDCNSDDWEIAGIWYYCDNTFTVEARKAGTTTVYISNGNGISAECRVTVEPIKVESISMNSEMSITVGDGRTLYPSISPSNADNKELTYSSSNKDVATVNDYGYVEAISVGTAVITATAKDGSGVSATCTVNVKKSISLYNSEMVIYIGDTESNTAYVYPESEDDSKDVEWSSSNEDIATVDEDGNITGISEGEVTITATAIDGGGAFATCTVTVRDGSVKGISFEETELEVNINRTKYLDVIFNPTYAKNTDVTWSSSNEDIATVNSYGRITGISEGKAVITAKSDDGGFEASCTVTVSKVPVAGVSLSDETLEIGWHNGEYLYETISPSNATYKNVTWKSSNEDIATVDESGYVYGNKEGTAVITVTTEDGEFEASCTVTVKQIHVTGISFDKTEVEIEAGNYEYITATILPDDADDKSITWSSSNPDIAEVTSYWWRDAIHAKSPGNATITATTADGGYTASINVTVKPVSVTGISLSYTSIVSDIDDSPCYLYTTIAPSNATNKNVTWTQSDDSVAEIDDTYDYLTVSAKKVGTTTITAKTEDGGFEASCEFHVPLSMEQSELNLIQGNTSSINFEYNTNLFPDGITLESSNENVATVDENGLVTAVGGGYATITLSGTYDGTTYSKICRVYVTGTSGTLSGSNVTWRLGDDGTTLYFGGSGSFPSQYSSTEYDTYADDITKIVFEGDVTSIGYYAFKNYGKLEKVVLSDKISEIDPYAFTNRTGFAWEISETNTNFRLQDGVLFSYDMKTLLFYPISKTDEKYVVPSTVETIGSNAFGYGKNNTYLKKLVIDKTLKAIEYGAFSYCNLSTIYYCGTNVEWYNGVQGSWNNVSDSCAVKFNYVPTTLENGFEYFVKDGAAHIYEYQWPATSTSLNLTIPSELGGYPVKVIESNAFPEGSIDELIISEGIETIKYCAFEMVTIGKVVLPSTLTKIGSWAFPTVGKSFTVHSDNKNYSSQDGVLFNKDKTILFQYPYLKEDKSYTVPSEVKFIGFSAFRKCTSLETLDLGDNVTDIEYYAFDGCSNLKSITIPATVTIMGYRVFNETSALTDIYYDGTQARWNSIDSQASIPDNVTIHYADLTDVAPVYMKTGSYTDTGFNYNVYLDSTAIGKTVAVAFYNKNKLVSIDYKTYNGEEYLEFERIWDFGSYDSVKAMVWDSVESMKPVFEPAVQEFLSDDEDDNSSTL